MTVKNHSKICLIVSASIMVVALILSLCGLGVNYGLDFTGGLSMQYDMGSAFDEADIKTALNGLGIESYTITSLVSASRRSARMMCRISSRTLKLRWQRSIRT